MQTSGAGFAAKDPYRCLRCSAVAIGIWNILHCLVQFGLLGWQIQVVKQWQWFWENRELPATGAIDQYQARFPGLYQIYTETPERRRVNAMYAIVLICMGLNIVHLPLSAGLLYGCVKRHPHWVLPWFFTSLPLILLCTAYSVLWWSGDVFNEQLTFSVVEFTLSLAVNGVCFVVVVLYYLRLRGRLTSERMAPALPRRRPPTQQFIGGGGAPKQHSDEKLPPWIESFPDEPAPNIARKLRRKERRERGMAQRVERTRAEEERRRSREASRKRRSQLRKAQQTDGNWH